MGIDLYYSCLFTASFRVNTADGRKTAWVNDRRASGDVLRRLSDCLVELHGQHDDRGLLNPSGHRALLDDFAGAGGLLDDTRAAWRAVAAAQRALTAAENALEEIRAEEDFLRHAVAELDALDPQPGEEAALDAARRGMQAAGRIRGDVIKAHGALGGDGAEGAISDAMRWLEDAAGAADGRLDAAIAALGRALTELGEAEQGVAEALDAMDFDPAELERVEERLFAIRALARKHGVTAEELGEFAGGLRARLAALDGGASGIRTLRTALSDARAGYDAAASVLTRARIDAAERLDRAMAAELAPLKMERAVFATGVEAGEPGPDGTDAVSFSVATNPGAPAGPLNRIASGGELSRFLLALKVCLTGGGGGLTLIFDEIDRGVGGATADAVGRRLAALAERGQVLVVTHSPQVAARGQHHWQVAKLSSVTPLEGDRRVDEIARMLAGDTVTEEARGAARALLTG